MLAMAVATTSIFATSPVTEAKTVEVVTEASQVNAENQIIIHAKGTGLCIYAWGGSASTKEFPGDPMTEDKTMGSGWCYATVPADCTGFIISQSSGAKLTDDVKGMKAGEYWFVDGKFHESNPEGPTPEPTPTPVPTPAPLAINNVMPADGTALKAGEAQAITVDATSTINDKVVYYKYEVKTGGKIIGDHYYSKNSTYSFTPEDGKDYTVTVYVQAHDEANTTVKKEYKYTGSKDGQVVTPGVPTTPGASNGATTPAPSATAPNVSEEPSATVSTPTVSSGTPSPNVTTPVQEGSTPAIVKPGESNIPSETPKISSDIPQPSTTPNIGPIGGGDIDEKELYVEGSVDKSGTIDAGTEITLKAQAGGGDHGNYKYKFFYKKSGGKKTAITSKYTSKNTCTWTPKVNGTYTLYVTAKDGGNISISAKIGTIKVKGLTATLKANKKSPQKKNKKIKLTVTPKNASGTVKYRFIIKLNGKTQKDTKYQRSSKYTWKPKKKGTYKITVKIKDKNTTITKNMTFKIK